MCLFLCRLLLLCYEYPFQGYFVNCLSAMVAIGYVYSRAGLAALLLYCEYPVQGQLH